MNYNQPFDKPRKGKSVQIGAHLYDLLPEIIKRAQLKNRTSLIDFAVTKLIFELFTKEEISEMNIKK